MSLLFPKRRKPEERLIDRASVYGTVDPITAFLNGSSVVSSAETVLRLAPVYAATNLIASQLASLPWPGYVDRDGMRMKLDPQPELLTNPSMYGTFFDWKFRLTTSVLLAGNAVGIRGGEYRGWPSKVEWLNPSDVTCEEDTPGQPLFYKGRRLDEAEVVHIPGFVLPGKRWGLSPIGAFRSIVDLGLAAQDFAAEWFTTGAPVPKGILRNTELSIVKDQAAAAKESYKTNMSHGDVFVTGKDWEWTSVQMPADDVRFIEAIKMSATQIAAVYLVPPELIGGETGSSLTYSTVEQNMMNLGSLALRPWATRFEDALTGLLPRGQYVKANLDAMVRSDTKTKYDVFKIQSEIKHRTQNELRALDDLPPIEGGDEFPEPPAAPAPGQPVEEPDPKDSEARHLAGQHDQSSHGRGGGSRVGMGDVRVPVEDLRGGSAEQYLRPDGTFTPERQALHDDIVRRAVDGIPPSADPTFHMLGGGTAAGKTTAINSGIVKVPGKGEAVQINADDVKSELPEAGTRKDWACFTHEESSYVAKRIQAAAIERGQDFVLDGTGDSSAGKVMAKIDAARAAGYKVVGTYATVPTGLAIQRSNARGDRTGRYVPEEAIRAIHASVSDTFPKVASSFDSITLIDTAGATPRVLARASLGSRVDVVDDIGYTAFLAKANG